MATLLVLLLSSVACANGHIALDEPVPTTPSPATRGSDEMLELRVGATAPVPGTAATLTFVRVANDSRCPKGVTCIWEGDAVVELRAQSSGGEARTVELHVNDRFVRQATIDGVTVTLERLDPYPEADTPVPAASYVVALRIGAK